MEKIEKKCSLGNLTIMQIDYKTAKQMTIENHYSKKWNNAFGKINYGIFKDGKLLGCAVFGNLMNPESYKNITLLDKDSVIELNRMWISDELGKNAETILISSSFKLMKKEFPQIKFIQSFADGRLGCGTIYKASNFNYYGYEESLFFENIDTGEVFHKVPLENTKRPLGFLSKNKLYLENKLKAFYVKTYRYIYILDKKHKTLIKEEKYPEYDKGIRYVNYSHPIGILARLYLMYNTIDDKIADLCMNYIKSRFSQDEIEKAINAQKENESYKWFLTEYIMDIKNFNSLSKELKESQNDDW